MGRENLYQRLSLSRLEGGGLAIKGVVVAAYCTPFLLLMSTLLLLLGLLLTAISWRPDLMQYYYSQYDLGEEWTSRLDDIARARLAGPLLIGVSLLLMTTGLVLGLLNRLARVEERRGGATQYRGNTDSFLRAWRREKEEKEEVETRGLLSVSSMAGDIACFPDNSSRSISRLSRLGGTPRAGSITPSMITSNSLAPLLLHDQPHQSLHQPHLQPLPTPQPTLKPKSFHSSISKFPSTLPHILISPTNTLVRSSSSPSIYLHLPSPV